MMSSLLPATYFLHVLGLLFHTTSGRVLEGRILGDHSLATPTGTESIYCNILLSTGRLFITFSPGHLTLPSSTLGHGPNGVLYARRRRRFRRGRTSKAAKAQDRAHSQTGKITSGDQNPIAQQGRPPHSGGEPRGPFPGMVPGRNPTPRGIFESASPTTSATSPARGSTASSRRRRASSCAAPMGRDPGRAAKRLLPPPAQPGEPDSALANQSNSRRNSSTRTRSGPCAAFRGIHQCSTARHRHRRTARSN